MHTFTILGESKKVAIRDRILLKLFSFCKFFNKELTVLLDSVKYIFYLQSDH